MITPLDNTDKRLLDILQTKFPLVARPFRRIGTMLAIEEDEVIERLKKLKEAGIIRRIGPLFNAKAFGYKSCLIAIKSNRKESELVAYLNGFNQVTHNYQREGAYDIWFTFTYKTDDELTAITDTLRAKFNISEIIRLPSIKTYKLRTEFHAD